MQPRVERRIIANHCIILQLYFIACWAFESNVCCFHYVSYYYDIECCWKMVNKEALLFFGDTSVELMDFRARTLCIYVFEWYFVLIRMHCG